jgi:hypothetical protein
MDWIKVCKNTPDKPEIRHVARATGCTPGDAFAAWFRIWAWLDGATADGHLPLATAEDIDEVARLPGMAKAFAEAGWLELHSPAGVTVMRWDTHNGESAKARALSAKRMAHMRHRTGKDSGYRPWHKK